VSRPQQHGTVTLRQLLLQLSERARSVDGGVANEQVSQRRVVVWV
jgi:hypothetical protein